MSLSKSLYHRRRFPAEVISHCVWLHFRFCLSYRDVEALMAQRGVVVTYETIRDGSRRCGGIYAKRLRSRASRPGDRWHLDEVYLSINGNCSICGALLIRTAKYSTSWFSRAGTRRRPRDSSGSCSSDCGTCRGPSSPNGWPVVPPPRQRCCPMSNTYEISDRTMEPENSPTRQLENGNVASGASSRPDPPALSRNLRCHRAALSSWAPSAGGKGLP